MKVQRTKIDKDTPSQTGFKYIELEDLPNAKPTPFDMLVYPWIFRGSFSMLYGPKGHGKTWLTMILAIAVSRRKPFITKHDETPEKIGPWTVMSKTGVLYVDGEMLVTTGQESSGGITLKERFDYLKPDTIGRYGTERYPFTILASTLPEQTKRINLVDKDCRDEILQKLKSNKRYGLLILDNLLSLTLGFEQSKDQKGWSYINDWLLQIRQLGVATLIVNHATKDQLTYLGISNLITNMDFVVNVTRKEPDYHVSNYTDITVKFEAFGRAMPTEALAPFNLRYGNRPEDGSFYWQTSNVSLKETKKEQQKRQNQIQRALILYNIKEGMGWTQESIGMHPDLRVDQSRIGQVQADLRQEGYLVGDRKHISLTEIGKEHLDKLTSELAFDDILKRFEQEEKEINE